MRCTPRAPRWRKASCPAAAWHCCAARRALAALKGSSLDHDSGIRIVARALEEPLRRIVLNAGDEPSVVLHRIEQAEGVAQGYNAATREYGDLLQMGVIDLAKVTRLALQNAASIAALILTTDCMIANAPAARGRRWRAGRDAGVLGPRGDGPASSEHARRALAAAASVLVSPRAQACRARRTRRGDARRQLAQRCIPGLTLRSVSMASFHA